MKELEKKNWLKLYEIAEKIKELEPWKDLWDTELFVYIEDDDIDNSLYFCTMGKAGVHKSIAIYKGDQIDGYLELVEEQNESILAINYQECLKVCYLDRIDTLPGNQKLIKELGLKYRGIWTSFEKFEFGYEFGMLNNEDVKLMIKGLENYYEMFKKYKNEKLKIDFEGGQGYIRKYSTKTKKKNDVVDNILYVPKKYMYTSYVGDYKNILKTCTKTKMELELDFLNYLPFHIGDSKDKDGRYTYPLMFIMVDSKSQFVFDMNIYQKPDNYEEYIENSLKNIIELFKKIGIPKRIFVRDRKTFCVLEDFCKKLKIELVFSPSLPAIDYAYEMILNNSFDF